MDFYVNLGTVCNFRCIYCSQTTCVTESVTPFKFSPKAKDLIRQHLKDGAVVLWGGEPLLYWHRFKEVVQFVRSMGKNNIATVTNGSLLTNEKVDFLNEMGVIVTLSHDGEFNYLTRSIDILEDPRNMDMINRLEKKAFSSVITKYNQDIYKDVWGYFDRRFLGVKVCTAFIKDYGDGSLSDFDYHQLSKTFQTMVDGFVESVWRNNYSTKEARFFMPILKRYQHLSSSNLDNPRCGLMNRTLNIDLAGSIYLCHNSSVVIGETFEEAIAEFPRHNKFVNECSNCEHFLFCGIECPIVSENGHHVTCKISKLLFGKLKEGLRRLRF